MDGYTKAAIREELSKRTDMQVKIDKLVDLTLNGPFIYLFTAVFYGFWGWLIWSTIF